MKIISKYLWAIVSHLFDNDFIDDDSGLNKAKYPIPVSMQWAERSWILSACSIFSGSVNAVHYVAMTRNNDTGIFTLYNDDFVTKYRQRNALKDLQNNKHGLVYGLVYLKTWNQITIVKSISLNKY